MALLLFYATRCGLKKQFRNCFCQAARHDDMCARVCAPMCVCVLAKAPCGVLIQFPLRATVELSNANNAVVIVVFTSIKSWQLFLPALPKKAASFTAAAFPTFPTAPSSTAPPAPPIAIMQIRIADYQITNCNGSNCFVYSWHMAHANVKVGRQIVTANETRLQQGRGEVGRGQEEREGQPFAKSNCSTEAQVGSSCSQLKLLVLKHVYAAWAQRLPCYLRISALLGSLPCHCLDCV